MCKIVDDLWSIPKPFQRGRKEIQRCQMDSAWIGSSRDILNIESILTRKKGEGDGQIRRPSIIISTQCIAIELDNEREFIRVSEFIELLGCSFNGHWEMIDVNIRRERRIDVPMADRVVGCDTIGGELVERERKRGGGLSFFIIHNNVRRRRNV